MSLSIATDSNTNANKSSKIPDDLCKTENLSPSISSKLETFNQIKNKVKVFFENHATARRIFAYVPLAVLTLDEFTSYKVLPSYFPLRFLSIMFLLDVGQRAVKLDVFLAQKNIERFK